MILILPLVAAGCGRSGKQSDVNSIRLVASAIDSYEENTGSLPVRLEDLVPEYLDAVPVVSGNRLDYEVFGNEYSVGYFSEETGKSIFFLSRSGSMLIDENS